MRYMNYNMDNEMTEDEKESFENAKDNYDVNGFARYIGEVTSEEGTRFGRQLEWDRDGNFKGARLWIV